MNNKVQDFKNIVVPKSKLEKSVSYHEKIDDVKSFAISVSQNHPAKYSFSIPCNSDYYLFC